jgi:hypothetical protein
VALDDGVNQNGVADLEPLSFRTEGFDPTGDITAPDMGERDRKSGHPFTHEDVKVVEGGRANADQSLARGRLRPFDCFERDVVWAAVLANDRGIHLELTASRAHR